MNEIDRIREQMKHLFVEEDWVGATIEELLADIPAEHARPVFAPWRHSIWEIVLHLRTTQQLILDRVRGIDRPFQKGDDWPSVTDPSPDAWERIQKDLLAADEELRAELQGFPNAALEKQLTEWGRSAYNNFHGYIQHAYYHAGQISVLKRLTSGAQEASAT